MITSNTTILTNAATNIINPTSTLSNLSSQSNNSNQSLSSTNSASILMTPLLTLNEQIELTRSLLMKDNSTKQEEFNIDNDLYVDITPTISNTPDSKVIKHLKLLIYCILLILILLSIDSTPYQ